MIDFNYETDFTIANEETISTWITKVLTEEGFKEGEINYVFCNDEYLHKLNVEFLDHDTLTDVISFDYTMGKLISGDIFISIDRVRDNAKYFKVDFINELYRVMVHGILHYCGYKDKSQEDAKTMRAKENHYLGLINS
ncbi:rRNA maturation RNase YbeY [Postechiella marina]|uniref:Endoribonuclease YbeY n=1 Tax=Postechiella marina TaxID=943941 RepID=A0ABP8C5H7_9FLAO